MNRVLLIPSSDYVGHPFPQRHNHIFERVNSNGSFEVHVVRFDIFGRERLDTNVIVHELRDLRFKPLCLYYLVNMAFHSGFIRRLVRNEDIDIVVLSNLSPCFIYRFINDNSVPFLFDLPDYFPASATGYITSPSSVLGRGIASGLESILKIILRYCCKTTVASHALLEYTRSLGVKCPTYLPNGVGEEFFRTYDGDEVRERFRVGRDEVLVGYVGSLAFWLNLKPLLNGLRMARKHGIPVKLLLVGGNLHSDYVSLARGWVKDRGLDDSVIFTGFVPYREVPRYVAAMDLGVLPHDVSNPTGYYAGPNKIWEYLSQGKLVLASPIPEVLHYKSYLEIVNDAEAYFKVLENFYRDPTPFIEEAEKGRELAKTMTWENSARMMEKLLLDIIHN